MTSLEAIVLEGDCRRRPVPGIGIAVLAPLDRRKLYFAPADSLEAMVSRAYYRSGYVMGSNGMMLNEKIAITMYRTDASQLFVMASKCVVESVVRKQPLCSQSDEKERTRA